MVGITTEFILFDILLSVLAVFIAIYVYYKHSYQYWRKKKVPYLEPTFPYGNCTYIFPKSVSFAGEAKIWYDQLKARGCKFGGVWSFSRAVLVIIDPDYIKDILSQDFHYFMDRDFYSNEKHDPLGTHIFNITSHGWKPLRQKFTPTFTSGKMKMMFESILKCSDFMINYLEKCAKMQDDIDIRDVLASFTTDVIGSVAFGIDCNSFDNTHAEFRSQGRKMFQFSNRDYIRLLVSKNFQDFSRKVRIGAGKSRPKMFFANMMKHTIEYRKKNNVNRKDFLQILIDMNEATKEEENKFTFEQIVANTILFFIAGFDTSSSTMTSTLYELARHPDIQDKVRREITEIINKYDNKITYEGLKEMTYLQQVIDEAMRLYPPLLTLSRRCTKNYQLKNTNITIEKGTPVVISTLALGRDPEHFPDPERFDPERFSTENKAKRHPYVHIPFGEGPRNCIGLRFGIMQSKIGLIKVLTNFNLTISPKTKMPLRIDDTALLLKETETLFLKAEEILQEN